jgi:AraC-like DNA-binding protein
MERARSHAVDTRISKSTVHCWIRNSASVRRSGAVVKLLRLARQLVQRVESGGTGFTLQALTDGLIEQLQAWDRIAPWSVVRHPRADRPVSVADVAAALHLSQRTLQAGFRAEREMSPVWAIQRLRRWPPPP